jgi:hypothetical protein
VADPVEVEALCHLGPLTLWWYGWKVNRGTVQMAKAHELVWHSTVEQAAESEMGYCSVAVPEAVRLGHERSL